MKRLTAIVFVQNGNHCKMAFRQLIWLLLAALLLGVFSPNGHVCAQAQDCPQNSSCSLPRCLCSATTVPTGLSPAQVPQMVFLSFDGAVSNPFFQYYDKLMQNPKLKNRNGCKIGMTFFISHEWTNYSMVHDLWAAGHEIALHSITKNESMSYWATLSYEGWVAEMKGLRNIIIKNAKIPAHDIVGIRAPYLQIGGNNMFKMVHDIEALFDASMPTQRYVKPGLWPYTLQFKSIQDCVIPPCPTQSFRNTWEFPIIDHQAPKRLCSVIDACEVTTKQEAADLFWSNFNRQYSRNRAPHGLFTRSGIFMQYPEVYEAYTEFLEKLVAGNMSDVYLVTMSDGLAWLNTPTKTSDLGSFQPWQCPRQPPRTSNCTAINCYYPPANGGNEHYFITCADSCPTTYPWLGNTDGL